MYFFLYFCVIIFSYWMQIMRICIQYGKNSRILEVCFTQFWKLWNFSKISLYQNWTQDSCIRFNTILNTKMQYVYIWKMICFLDLSWKFQKQHFLAQRIIAASHTHLILLTKIRNNIPYVQFNIAPLTCSCLKNWLSWNNFQYIQANLTLKVHYSQSL